MKSVIVYYSYSGNTKKTAEVLAGYLRQKGGVDIIELKALDESKSFFGQASRAFWRKRARIQLPDTDLSSCDLICFGTPVWAFGPAPAMNAYLDNCKGVAGKEAVLFTTYGSGAGNTRCLDYMQNILAYKGVKTFKRFSIQQFKVKDAEFTVGKIKEALSV